MDILLRILAPIGRVLRRLFNIGIPLKDLTTRPGNLVAVILHQGKVIVPFGNDIIEAGDHVVIISRESGIGDLNEVLYK